MKLSLRRPQDCHKGDFGHAWIIAGSTGMAGAGCLTVAAALRSGAGKTTWVTTRETYRVMGRAIPEAMSLSFPESAAGGLPASSIPVILKKIESTASCVAIGPGLGRTAATRRLVRSLIAQSRVPLVLDADALWALEGSPGDLKKAKILPIITPHAGELRRLFGTAADPSEATRRSVAKRIANQYHCVLVSKGPRSLVAAPGQKVHVNATGNPGLAKGGSGDVLTGVIAGLSAQGFDPRSAACIGVWAHGRAADLAVRVSSMTSLASSDLLKSLPAVWAELEKKKSLAGLTTGN